MVSTSNDEWYLISRYRLINFLLISINNIKENKENQKCYNILFKFIHYAKSELSLDFFLFRCFNAKLVSL
jgi:hypothetical protein